MSVVEYNYNRLGSRYRSTRATDPVIAKAIHAPLANASTILNVGAGTGSYEPLDRYVVAVEPSAVMRAQRSAALPPAIVATAESLPFDDNAFDASMAVLTLHHWRDKEAGLREMRRVTRGPVVICTFDIDRVPDFWMHHYAPEFVDIDRMRFPSIEFITETLGGVTSIASVRIPLHCIDGIQEAFYGRPEAFLDPAIRAGQSIWACLASGAEERIVRQLQRDLDSGEWDRNFGYLRTQPTFASALRVITATYST